MALDWVDIGKVALTSGVVAAVVTWVKEVFVHRASRKRDARYLAQRLAVILERFSIDCADVIEGNETHRSSEGYAAQPRLRVPALAEFPADTDWKAIDPKLAGRALGLPNELALSEQKIVFWLDVVPNRGCAETETNQQAGKCGYRAWKLAVDLRNKHGLEKADLVGLAWGFVGTLKEQHDAALTSLRDEAENRAQVETKNRELRQAAQ